MKNSIIYILPVALFLTACKTNETTGEIEPTWLFWVFLGLIAFGLIAGVFTARRKTSQADQEEESKTEKEIEAFRETLEKKAEKENETSEDDNSK